MFEVQGSADHEAIMRRAHQMRAEVFADMLKAAVAFFRRKPAGQVSNA